MQSIDFLEQFIIKQSKKHIDNKSYLSSIIILSIGLEIMGGFFDKKPLKSPKQSKLRFRIAVNKLMDVKYSRYNLNDNLYESMRNQLVHSLLIGGKFKLSLTEKHLNENDGFVVFNPLLFHNDMIIALKRLCVLIEENKAFIKKIPDNSEFLVAFS